MTADSITCPRCGRTSWNENDVRERYCGACHVFHGDARSASTDSFGALRLLAITLIEQELRAVDAVEVVVQGQGDGVAIVFGDGEMVESPSLAAGLAEALADLTPAERHSLNGAQQVAMARWLTGWRAT